MQRNFAAPVVLFALCATCAADDPVVDQWTALKAEYVAAMEAWHAAYDQQGDDDQRIERYRDWPGWSFAPRFVEFGESAPTHESGFESLREVVRMVRSVDEHDRELQPHVARAVELILRDHRSRELTSLQFATASASFENLWRTLSMEGESQELRARATFCLGYVLKTKSDVIHRVGQSTDLPAGPLHDFIESRVKVHRDRYLASTTADEAAVEAVVHFESVITDYPDVMSINRTGSTLAELAKAEIFEINHRSIGRKAPEIAGLDLTGVPIKLSDFRGKVVLLVFWASWCGPCMQAVPHERELAERFADRPFAIVGVNLDQTLEQANEAVEKHAIPWRSVWDGGEEFGPVSTGWNVRSVPKAYVIDHTGVIRFTQLLGTALDEPIALLVREAENG